MNLVCDKKICLTSPRPSPLHPMERRGRNAPRVKCHRLPINFRAILFPSNQDAATVLKTFRSPAASSCCSLSPGERVRVRASVNPLYVLFVFMFAISAALNLFAADISPYSKVEPLPLGAARWTEGFWADRFALCQRQMIPSMGRLMAGTNYTQFLRNFEIVAGLAEGKARGASFNDGDFYKWMEAASATLAVTNDVALRQQLDEIVAIIAKAQRADGYIDTAVQIRAAAGDTNAVPFADALKFETYNMGHLLTAACVHHRVTGQTNFLVVAQKAADFLVEAFKHPTPDLASKAICPSHYMGMVEIWRETGDPRYLELAKKFLAMRSLIKDGGDDNQDRIPFEDQETAEGHAVRANYLYAGAADLFLETGDTNLWKPLVEIWTNVVTKKMYITGGCGALYDGASPDAAKDQKSISRVHQAYGRNYQLPNTTAHSETCANIGNVLWNWRMFLATGDAKFMDVVELEFYNAVLSGGGLDGTNFFYTNPLRVTDPLPTELRWSRTRVPFVSTFCCPPNLARTIAESADYAYAKSGDAIWVNLYGGSSLSTELNGEKIRLSQQTDYPWNGRVRIRVKACGQKEFALKLRIPGWAKSATVRVNNGPADESVKSESYFEIHRIWQPGDFVDLDLPMPARLMEANPLVEEDLNQVAVQRGPVVYCIESPDLPRGVKISDVMIPDDIQLVARYDRRLLDGVVVLEGKALVGPEANWNGKLYRDFKPTEFKPFNVRFIPYSVWQNRGLSEMSVWLPLAAQAR
jgi:DUF1680 family protein